MPRSRTGLPSWLRGFVAACVLAGGSASGQPLLQTPAREFELETPGLREELPPEFVLPPIPALPPDAPLGAVGAVFVRAFRFEGNTVFGAAELEAVTTPWTGREIRSDELRVARDAVTRHYIGAGYESSGAVLPDQPVDDGVVLLRIVEGRLRAVEVEGADAFRPSYFQSRLHAGSERPLRVQELEERLARFQQDPRLHRIAARLEPAEQRGESVLHLRVEEAFPASLGLEWSNDVPPSLGEQSGRVDASLVNILGVGDELSGGVRFAEGLVDPEIRYGVPLNRWDTELEARVRYSDAKIVEEPFESADFTSTAFTAGAGILQPVWRTLSDTARIGLLGEWRRGTSEVDGEGIGFPGSGADPEDGESTLSVLRLGAEWLHRGRARVFAARQLVSFGVPVLGATSNPSGTPDSEFVSFLTQLRFAERTERLLGTEILLRADLQLSTQPLMPLEQIGVGGFASVRGYRENQIVRDQAVIGALELRLPIYRDAERGHVLQLAPFFDVGHGFSTSDRDASPDAKTLVGTGVGLRYRFRNLLSAELFWGASLSNVSDPPDDTLQDDGIYFRVRTDLP